MDPKFIAMAMTVLSAFIAIPAACIGLTTALYDPPNLPMRPAPIWETTPTPQAVHRETRLPQQCSVEDMTQMDTRRAIVVVEEVIDGDTIRLANRSENLRLWGIDAPESDQPGGAEAKAMLEQLVPADELLIMEALPDLGPYGRLIGIIGREDQPAANHQMVETGWAFHYENYAPGNDCLWNAERQARISHAGLWGQSEDGGVRPWQWRRQTSRE